MANINMTIRIDDGIKEQADKIFNDLGMTTNTAINVFLRQSIITKGFPFRVSSKDQMERFLERAPRIGYRDSEGYLVLPNDEDYEGDSIYDNYKPSAEGKVEHMAGRR